MIESHYDLRSRVAEARLRCGLSIDQLATRISISSNNLYDIEAYDTELNMCVSVQDLVELFRELKLDPVDLFRPGSGVTGSFGVEELGLMLQASLQRDGAPVPEFENRIGWRVAAALVDSHVFFQFNLDGLRAVADAVGADWVDVLGTEMARLGSRETPPA